MNKKENVEMMKNQTFGVEIEMGVISKEDAKNIVYHYYKTNHQNAEDLGYIGGSHSPYACLDNKGRKWKFMDDGSSGGRLGCITCEMVTPILTYDDIEDLQCIVRLLRENGARSGANYNAGVHIHIGANIDQEGGHNAKTLRNLVNIMASHELILIKSINVSAIRERWCSCVNRNFLTKINSLRPTTMRQLNELWYGYYQPHVDHYDSTRYHMLNLHAIWDKGTIEFRLFEFHNGLHAGELKAWIQLCMALSNYAKIVTYSSYQPIDMSNEKYAMKNWLINMGFIGDEFKTARKMLTKRLNGDTAYRNGRTHNCDDNDLDDLQLDTHIQFEG